MFLIIKIDKNEMKYLTSKGVRFGEDGISSTVGFGKKKKYYMCESYNNRKLHTKYQKEIRK